MERELRECGEKVLSGREREGRYKTGFVHCVKVQWRMLRRIKSLTLSSYSPAWCQYSQ